MSNNNIPIKPFKGQVYEQLKAQCNKNRLFEDNVFPANNKSMFFSQPVPRGVTWRRPFEVMRDPKFVVDGYGRGDLDQGFVGNCWFIAACVGIMQSEHVFNRVVPTDQSFENNYGGIFHFRFWLYGEWVDVVIDDRLPFYQDGRLVFCSNKQNPNELWGPLLEKAYAKLYGSYEALEGGFTSDALIDMTGGIEESFELKTLDAKIRNSLFSILSQSYNKDSIISCSIAADPSVREAQLSNGLVRGHAYTVTNVIVINTGGKDIRLIRCRNPWGNDVEWKGPWSDASREWNSVDDRTKKELGLVYEKDGEFWMSYSDFLAIWDTIQICHISCDSFSDEILKQHEDEDLYWQCTTYQSEWNVATNSAGGSGQPNMSKFWTNPQFLIKLEDVDKDDHENMASLIIALMQKDTRLKKQETGGEAAEEYVQFRVFKVRDNVPLSTNQTNGLRFYANQLDKVSTSGNYVNKREITARIRVPPGNYVIIPSTFDENRNCKFMLRLFTETPIESGALKGHKDKLDKNDINIDKNDLGKHDLVIPAVVDNSNKQPTPNQNPQQPKPIQNPQQPTPNQINQNPKPVPVPIQNPKPVPVPIQNPKQEVIEDACLIM